MQRKNVKAVAVLCAAVPVIAIAAFIISRVESEDAPGLYISDSSVSAGQNDGENGGGRDNGNRKTPDGKDIEDPTEDKPEDKQGESKDHSEGGDGNTQNGGEAGNNTAGGNNVGDNSEEKPNTKDAVSKNGSSKDSSSKAASDSKKGSNDSKADSTSKKGDTSSKKSDTSTTSPKDKNDSKNDTPADKDDTSNSSPSEEPIPKDDVKYTFDTLDKMVDGNFHIATSGHIHYMVNANVSGEADYYGSDTHIKVESSDFPAVNSDTYTQSGECYRVIDANNATYSRNASLVSSFIDFGRVFHSFSEHRDELVPLECTTEGGITTEKFSYTYYDELCYYDYLTLIITIQYDGSGAPISLNVTTNEDYGYEEIYRSDSLSFAESVGGVDIPDFSGWTCVDNS